MSRGRLVFVYGTRPEALKIGPVVAALQGRAQVSVIATGQHTDLLKGTPAETDLAGGLSLVIPAHPTWEGWVEEMQGELMMALREMVPIACVVVQGDTMSALAGARAASALKLPLAHIEAGLRSHDLQNPYPEEGIRREITTLADFHYAPTETALWNLQHDLVDYKRIFLTGNTVVSALERYSTDGLLHVTEPKRQVLVTMHRREWLNTGFLAVRATVETLVAAATRHDDIQFLWPLHPSVQRVLNESAYYTADIIGWTQGNVQIVEPMPYQETVHYLRHSLGVITDSGGLQEEAATLGVPCAVMRTVSDRPESITAGTAQLFDPTPQGMTKAVQTIASQALPRKQTFVYGQPNAANLIASHIASLT